MLRDMRRKPQFGGVRRDHSVGRRGSCSKRRVVLPQRGAYVGGVPDPTRDLLISLCERVLDAEMMLDEFEQAWPEPVENPALAPLREALQDGIEHTPGHIFRPSVNIRAWQRSPEYADIASHLRRLRENE
jgi:hypothetical protein